LLLGEPLLLLHLLLLALLLGVVGHLLLLLLSLASATRSFYLLRRWAGLRRPTEQRENSENF